MITQIYKKLLELEEFGKTAVLVTVVDKEGHGPAKIGSKMIVISDGELFGTVGGGAIERIAIEKAKELLRTQRNLVEKYHLDDNENLSDAQNTGMVCGGVATLFFEYVSGKEQVYIFGGGHIGKALWQHLFNMSYHVTVIDSREEMLRGIPAEITTVHGEYNRVFDKNKIQPGSYIVIVTHSHDLDYIVLKRLFQENWNPKYIGLISSRKKKQLTLDKLTSELEVKPDLSKLYSPIGLDIGGESPHEIAISIISELQAVRYNKPNPGHLRDS